MKLYNRTLLVFVCLVVFAETKAQLTVYAGPLITSAKYTIRDAEQPTESKYGLMAGVRFEANIEGPVYFSPMIFYAKKGYKVRFDRPASPPDSIAINNNTSIHAIEVAPLIQVNLSKKPNYFFARFGPSFDINISGNEQFDTTGNKPVNRPMKFDFTSYGYVTTALNAHFGYQMENGFTIFAHYMYGIGNLNSSDFGPVIFHRAAGISVGWRFKYKK